MPSGKSKGILRGYRGRKRGRVGKSYSREKGGENRHRHTISTPLLFWKRGGKKSYTEVVKKRLENILCRQ